MKSIDLSIPWFISDEFQLLLTKVFLKVQVSLYSAAPIAFSCLSTRPPGILAFKNKLKLFICLFIIGNPVYITT